MHYPAIDPIIFSLGPLAIRWYGLAYLCAFAAAWWLGNVRARASAGRWDEQAVSDVIFYGAGTALLLYSGSTRLHQMISLSCPYSCRSVWRMARAG